MFILIDSQSICLVDACAMVDVVPQVGDYSPLQMNDINAILKGQQGFMELNAEDVSFLYSCRTRVSEVGHVLQFICRYIFSGDMRVEPRGPVADWVDFRTFGYRVLEQLLIYGMCFVSYDEENREPIVWDVAELNIQVRRTSQGHVEFRARVSPTSGEQIGRDVMNMASGKSRDVDQPEFIVLVHKYPESGRIVSPLMALKPTLQMLQPSIFAAMVATTRSANPVVYYTHTDNGKMTIAARQQWAQGDGAAIQQRMRQQEAEDQARLMQQFEAMHASYARPAVSAMQLAYAQEDRNSKAVAYNIMAATTHSPIRTLPVNFDVSSGPTTSVDMKFCEFLHELVRLQISRAFGLPSSIFAVEERYMAGSVAGFANSIMQSSMNHFASLVKSAINYTYQYAILPQLSSEEIRNYKFNVPNLAEPSGTVEDDSRAKEVTRKRKVESSKSSDETKNQSRKSRYPSLALPSATAETDVVSVEIMRRMDIEVLMLLKPELKRDAFIDLLSETLGLSPDDFEEKDRELELQKHALILGTKPNGTVSAPKPLSSTSSSSSSSAATKRPKLTPSQALSTAAISKLK